jgi:arylsulfatase A-like enzyme
MSGERPNFVLIVSDDMGYSDLPKFGDSEIATPALDSLAEGGVVFTNGYVTAPICTPSRMAMVTGCYQQRYGAYDMYSHLEGFGPFREEVTVAEVLRRAGYRTGLVGKWHMGSRHCISGEDPGHPSDHGFEDYVGIAWGMSSYVPGVRLYRGREAFEAPEYLTDFFGKEACDFIERNRGEPFFLMLAFNAVHAPLEATEGDLAALGGEWPGSPDRKTYAAMLGAMDRNVGRVLEKLEAAGLSENTVVGFVNDNGGGGNHTPEHTRNTGRNAPLRGFKFDLYEGGVRVPMLLRWPGRIEPGQVFEGMVSAMDFAPTFLAAAGLAWPEGRVCDGVDLMPWLRGEGAGDAHETLYWKNRVWAGPRWRQTPQSGFHNCAMRRGKWKMVRRMVPLDATGGEPWELYDLSRDIGEQHDLAREYEGVVRELQGAYLDWLRGMHPPLE